MSAVHCTQEVGGVNQSAKCSVHLKPLCPFKQEDLEPFSDWPLWTSCRQWAFSNCEHMNQPQPAYLPTHPGWTNTVSVAASCYSEVSVTICNSTMCSHTPTHTLFHPTCLTDATFMPFVCVCVCVHIKPAACSTRTTNVWQHLLPRRFRLLHLRWRCLNLLLFVCICNEYVYF